MFTTTNTTTDTLLQEIFAEVFSPRPPLLYEMNATQMLELFLEEETPSLKAKRTTGLLSNDKSGLRKNARSVLEYILKDPSLLKGRQVDHIIPLHYSYLFKVSKSAGGSRPVLDDFSHPNSIYNLRLVSTNAHTIISKQWSDFNKSITGELNKLKKLLLDKANIDVETTSCSELCKKLKDISTGIEKLRFLLRQKVAEKLRSVRLLIQQKKLDVLYVKDLVDKAGIEKFKNLKNK